MTEDFSAKHCGADELGFAAEYSDAPIGDLWGTWIEDLMAELEPQWPMQKSP